jgi:putative glutamine amidotransferase
MALILSQFHGNNQCRKVRMSARRKPLVWLPLCIRHLGDSHAQQPFLTLGDKYARAVKLAADAQPVSFPLADASDIAELLQGVDGVMLTGSPSNVHPVHFDEEVTDPSLPLDEARDALTLALVRACTQHGVPLLGICRGFQEMNVAMGGTLHQQVHAVFGKNDHREDQHATLEAQYAPNHEVRFAPGSVFEQWAAGASARVNSLHGQGVARLAPGLKAEAFAPDGLVEAFSVEGARSFAYGVQWHPEWRVWQADAPALYRAIFRAFGQACQMRQQARLRDDRRLSIAA